MKVNRFLHQLVTEPIRGDTILDSVLLSDEDITEELVIKCILKLSGNHLIQFKLSKQRSITIFSIASFQFQNGKL